MRTITIDELKTLRAAYKSTKDESISRINALDRPQEFKDKRIASIERAADENEKAIAAFDRVMAKLESGPLPPDSHGCFSDKEALWNGALLIVKHNPLDYQLEIPQYGEGFSYVRL
jgi:hypothetical protein